MFKKEINRKKRHNRIRKKISGTPSVPRVSVKRSLANLSVQLIDDVNAKTIIGLSTTSKEIKEKCPYGGNIAAAKALGAVFGERIKENGVMTVCFDRSGYQYKGRIKAFADAVREQGVTF